jgi:hypothetical protein
MFVVNKNDGNFFLTFAHARGGSFPFFPFGRFVPCLAISAVVDSFEIVCGLDINS